MSKIGNLINDMCPNGVRYEFLKDLVTISTGKLNANAMVEDGEYAFFTCDANPFRIDTYAFDGEAILISGNGSQVGHLNYYVGKFNAYQRTYVLMNFNKNVRVKYIYHYLSTFLKKHIDENSKKGSVPYITLPMLQFFKIAVPPVEIQDEIVLILEKMNTELITYLNQEQELRFKQYEYWKRVLLDIEHNKYSSYKLEEICFYSKDRINFTELNEENYISVENLLQNKKGKINASHVPTIGNSTKFFPGDILIGNIRPYLKKIWLSDCVGGTNGDVLAIRIKDPNKVNSKYLYYILSSDDFFEYDNINSKGAKMPRGSKDDVMKYLVSMPSIEEQSKIVKILDRFENLLNDMDNGIPAEIELRKQQYEYYRNKLLSFEEA